MTVSGILAPPLSSGCGPVGPTSLYEGHWELASWLRGPRWNETKGMVARRFLDPFAFRPWDERDGRRGRKSRNATCYLLGGDSVECFVSSWPRRSPMRGCPGRLLIMHHASCRGVGSPFLLGVALPDILLCRFFQDTSSSCITTNLVCSGCPKKKSCVYVRVFYFLVYIYACPCGFLVNIFSWCQVKKAGTLVSTLRSWRGIFVAAHVTRHLLRKQSY